MRRTRLPSQFYRYPESSSVRLERERLRASSDRMLKTLIACSQMVSRLFSHGFKCPSGSLVERACLFKAPLLLKEDEQTIQRVLVGGEVGHVHFQHLLCQAELSPLDVHICQMPD